MKKLLFTICLFAGLSCLARPATKMFDDEGNQTTIVDYVAANGSGTNGTPADYDTVSDAATNSVQDVSATSTETTIRNDTVSFEIENTFEIMYEDYTPIIYDGNDFDFAGTHLTSIGTPRTDDDVGDKGYNDSIYATFAYVDANAVKPAATQSRTNKLFVVISGQSNAAGETDSSPPWYVMDGNSIPDTYTYIQGTTRTPFSYPSGAAWAIEAPLLNELRQKYPDTDIYAVRYAVGATTLSEWVPGTAYYTTLTNYVSTLQGSYPMAGTPDVFVWSQGESDGSTANYSAQLDSLFDGLKSDLGNDDLKIIQNGIGYMSLTTGEELPVNELKRQWTAEGVNRFYFDTFDLEYRDDEYVHYTKRGLLELGRMYADAIESAFSDIRRPSLSASSGYIGTLGAGEISAGTISASTLKSTIFADDTALVGKIGGEYEAKVRNIIEAGSYMNFNTLNAQDNMSVFNIEGIATRADYPRNNYLSGTIGWETGTLLGTFPTGTGVVVNAYQAPNVSMAGWFKFPDLDNTPYYSPLSLGIDAGSSTAIMVKESDTYSGAIEFQVRDGASTIMTRYSNSTNALWHHIGMTIEGSNSNLTLYVDGNKAGTVEVPLRNESGRYAKFGTLPGLAGPYEFAMDDVYYSTNVMTTAEMQLLMFAADQYDGSTLTADAIELTGFSITISNGYMVVETTP